MKIFNHIIKLLKQFYIKSSILILVYTYLFKRRIIIFNSIILPVIFIIFTLIFTIIFTLCGLFFGDINYFANISDIYYFKEQLTATQEAEKFWHKSKQVALTPEEHETLKTFISIMDPPKTNFGHTDQDFRTEHANAGVIKAQLDAAKASGNELAGKKVETMIGSKRTINSLENSSSQGPTKR